MGLHLKGEVSLDGSGFERGLTRLGHSAGHFMGELKGFAAGAIGIYGIEQAIHKTIETAEDLVNTARRLDVTVEQLQIMRQAAKDNGTEMSALAGAMEKLNIAREKIFRGDKDAKKLLADFKTLGVGPEQLKKESAAGLIMGPISGTLRNKNVGDVALQLREIMGKGFGEVIPTIRSDFEELGAKMEHMGAIMSTETAVSLKQVADEAGLLAQVIIAQLAPVLVQFVDALYWVIGKIKGAAAFWGGATSDAHAGDVLNGMAEALQHPLKYHDKSRDSGALLPNGVDLDEGGKAMAKQEKEWAEIIGGIKAKLAEEAEKLKHPPVRTTGDEEPAAKAKPLRQFRTSEDALVRVGNFLGTSRAAISNLDQQKVTLLRTVAANTERTARAMADLNQRFMTSPGHNSVQFPA